jgi:hypothetical protein
MICIALILLFFTGIASAGNVTLPNYTELQELGAFEPMENLQSNSSALAALNVSDNYIFTVLKWDSNASYYDNTVRIVMFPITYGASDNFVGAWFYAFLIAGTLIIVYGKSKSLEVTTMIMLVISLVIIVANAGGALVLPASFMTVIYIAAILSFFGTMYALFGDD